MKRSTSIRSILAAIIILLVINECFSQGKEANNWYFGWGAAIEFNNGTPPSAMTNSQMYNPSGDGYGSASISDSNGVLLFYTDGNSIWNNQHQIMQNGTGMGMQSTAGAVIVPKPNNPNQYYYFNYKYVNNEHVDFQYSIIDMTLDNGLGGVIANKKNIFLLSNTSQHLTAVHHENGQEVWVITHTYNTSYYYAFLVNIDSLNTLPVISQAGTLLEFSRGYMKVSPDGDLLAIAQGNGPNIFMELLQFDNSEGIVSDDFIVHDPIGSEAVEFSPDNTKLYTISGALYQYDLSTGNPELILTSRQKISSLTGGGAIQIAPDGKIYVGLGGGTYYLHVIHDPDNLGQDCNFEENSVYLDGRQFTGCLPFFIQSYFADPEFETQNNCLGDPTEFTILQTNGMDSVFWKFNDFPNMPIDTSTSFNPVYTFSHADTFQVELTAYSNLNERTVTQEVVIYPIPEPELGDDTLFCEPDISLTLNANCEGDVFAWSTGQFGIPEITVNDTGLYWVNVSKDGCSGFDSIYVGLLPVPVVDTNNWSVTMAQCGIANGSIAGINVSGTQPLTYFWLDASGDTIGNTLDITGLAAGVYSLIINDGNDCDNFFGPVIITDDGMMSVDSVFYTNDHCGQSIGSISVFAPLSGNILYSIDGGNTYVDNGGLFIDLPAGSYNVMVMDEDDCEGVYINNPVVIQDIVGPEVTSVIVLPEENYGQNGQINISAFVSWGDAFYSIDNGSSFQQGNGLFTNLSAGTYYCVVEDAYGCDTTFQVVVDHITTTPLEAIAGNGNTCIGNAVVSPLQLNNFVEVKSFHVKITYDFNLVRCDGYINLNPELEEGFSANINTAIGEIYLEWEGEDQLSLPEYASMTELVFSALVDGTSAVNWQTGPGESEFLDVYGQVLDVDYYTGTLRIYTRPEIDMLDMQEVCEGDDIYIHPAIEGGSGDKTYYWTGPDGFVSTDSILSFSDIIMQQHGQYTLHVQDTLKCDDISEFNLIVNPIPEIDFAPYDTLYVEPGYELHAGGGYMDYLWNTGDQDEYIIIDSTGQYSVEVTSYSGCYNNESVYVAWSSIPIFVPNAFTPDGDGLNDIFLPVVRYDFVASYHLYIFNRWGQLIFESSDLQIGWDGTYKGEKLPGGVYVYRIDYATYGAGESKTEVLTGEVVVLR